jgi:multidrug efflux pump subunit AcrA (membrane-fusion protein)
VLKVLSRAEGAEGPVKGCQVLKVLPREDSMKRGLKRFFTVIVILAIIGGLGATSYYRYKEKVQLALTGGRFGMGTGENVDTATPVAVYSAQRGSISESLVLNGEIMAVTEVSIYSTVTGKVKEIKAGEGDRVEKEQPLAFIDRSEAGRTYALSPVESTIDGLVKSVLVEYGAYITPQVPLFQIIDMDDVEIYVHIPEKDIYRVKRGMDSQVRVVSYPDRIFRGRVDELSPVVDPVSRTLEARIKIPNKNHKLKPGMFGEVKIIVRSSQNSIVIPLAAVVQKDGKNVIYTVNDEKARMVEPEFDIREGDRIAVVSGIDENSKVIVIGQQNVRDGDPVKVTEEIGENF